MNRGFMLSFFKLSYTEFNKRPGLAYGGKLTALEIQDGKIVEIHNVSKLAA